VSSALHASENVGLSVSHLVIKYGDITAVDHVSFTAQAGRVTVILGPNGAGKTSTIEACEGFLAPTAGSVQVLGLDPFLERKQLNRQMGIMLQEGGIYPSARVAELVRQYCALYGNGVDADVLISRVGLQSVASTTYRMDFNPWHPLRTADCLVERNSGCRWRSLLPLVHTLFSLTNQLLALM